MIFDAAAKTQLLSLVESLEPSEDTTALRARIAELEVELAKYIARDQAIRALMQETAAKFADLADAIREPV